MSEPNYKLPDTFGVDTTAGARITDPATGVVYTLGVGAAGEPVYVAYSTWARAKSLLGPTWGDAKRRAETWGIAKAIVGT